MSKLGKRYSCAGCGTVVMCLKPSKDEFQCCGQQMGEQQMQELPSSD
jgi:hypothetical protein